MIYISSIIDFKFVDVYFYNRSEKNVSPLSGNTSVDDPKFASNNEISFLTDMGNKNVSEDIRSSLNIALKHKDHGAILFFASIKEEIVGVYCFSDMDKYIPYNFMKSIERNGRCGMIFHCRTSKMCQGRGIYSRALRMICKEYGPSFDNIMITAGSRNTASNRAIMNSGFEKKMRMTRFKILSYEKAWSKNTKSL